MIYLINLILTIFWDGILLGKKADGERAYHRRRILFIAIVSFQTVLISGLRGISIGPDTWNYENMFQEARNKYSWGDLWRMFLSFFSSGDYAVRDIGYMLFTKSFASVIPSFRVFLFVVAILFMSAFGVFLYRNCSDLCLAYALFDSFLYEFFVLTAIRQTLAAALVSFVGFRFVKEQKLLPFLLTAMVAATVHFSSVIMLPFYFISNVGESKRKYRLAWALALLILIFRGSLLRFIPMGMYAHYLQGDGIQSYAYICMLAVVVMVIYFCNGFLVQRDRNHVRLINGTLITFVLTMLALISNIMIRLGFYYVFYMVALIPELLHKLEPRSRRIVRGVFLIVLMFFTLRKSTDYKFFWQAGANAASFR